MATLTPFTRALETGRCEFFGRTEPRDYEAGSYNGNAYPAGTSMRVLVGWNDLDFMVLKVPGKNFHNLWPVLSQFGSRGIVVDIGFERPRGDEAYGVLHTINIAAAL